MYKAELAKNGNYTQLGLFSTLQECFAAVIDKRDLVGQDLYASEGESLGDGVFCTKQTWVLNGWEDDTPEWIAYGNSPQCERDWERCDKEQDNLPDAYKTSFWKKYAEWVKKEIPNISDEEIKRVEHNLNAYNGWCDLTPDGEYLIELNEVLGEKLLTKIGATQEESEEYCEAAGYL